MTKPIAGKNTGMDNHRGLKPLVLCMIGLRPLLLFFLTVALASLVSACDGDAPRDSKRYKQIKKEQEHLAAEVESLGKEKADLQKRLKAAGGIAKLTRPAPKTLPDGTCTRLFVVPAMGVDAEDLRDALNVFPLRADRLPRRDLVVLRSGDKNDPAIRKIQVDKIKGKESVKAAHPAVDLPMPAVITGRFNKIEFAADVNVLGIAPAFAAYLAGETDPAFGSKPTAKSPHIKALITRRLYDYLIDSAFSVSGDSRLRSLPFQIVFNGIKWESTKGTFRLTVGSSRVAMQEAEKTLTVTFEIVGITDRLATHAILLPQKTVRNIRQAFERSAD